MALPAEKDIRLPLLRVIADAGGELPMLEAVTAVERYFPEITDEDKRLKLKSGSLVWRNRVQWVRQSLVVQGHLFREPRGVWRITPDGLAHVRGDQPPVVVTPLQTPAVDGPRLHRELQDKLVEVARLLGFSAETEYSESPYRYDVVWKEFARAVRPEAVFEVQDKGNLTEALAKLQHARDIWATRLFLVVTGEKDQRKVEQLTGTYLSGTFHRLAPHLTVLTPSDVDSLHSDLARHGELLKKLVQK